MAIRGLFARGIGVNMGIEGLFARGLFTGAGPSGGAFGRFLILIRRRRARR